MINSKLHISKIYIFVIHFFFFLFFFASSTYKSLSGQRNLNEKKSRHASKASSAVGEASYTFGNADEVLNLHEEVLAESARPDNSDEFAPFILKDKYMTEKDARIKETDVPERMQVYCL